jgi:DNA ligase D-like protein (predicted 3'-phosphoesterase)
LELKGFEGMAIRNPLKKYKEMRDFKETPEPSGGPRKAGGKGKKDPIFVVQKHDATRLHYDFRLEVDGVLKSWAVPKGPSLNPREKRLAVPREDHPLDYAGFEGNIPEGNYGAGPVIVWDTGAYKNLKDISMEEALEQGHIAVWLNGKKLKGGFALTRLDTVEEPRWVLVKMKDDKADEKTDLTSKKPKSVLSGRTVEEIGRRG